MLKFIRKIIMDASNVIEIVFGSLAVLGGLSTWILSLSGRIVRLETKTEGIDDSLTRIEGKLDRLIESLISKQS